MYIYSNVLPTVDWATLPPDAYIKVKVFNSDQDDCSHKIDSNSGLAEQTDDQDENQSDLDCSQVSGNANAYAPDPSKPVPTCLARQLPSHVNIESVKVLDKTTLTSSYLTMKGTTEQQLVHTYESLPVYELPPQSKVSLRASFNGLKIVKKWKSIKSKTVMNEIPANEGMMKPPLAARNDISLISFF